MLVTFLLSTFKSEKEISEAEEIFKLPDLTG